MTFNISAAAASCPLSQKLQWILLLLQLASLRGDDCGTHHLAHSTLAPSTEHLAPSTWHLAYGTTGSVRESQNNRPNISSLCSAKFPTHCRRGTSSILVFILTLKTSCLEHIRQTMCRVFQSKWPSIYLAR